MTPQLYISIKLVQEAHRRTGCTTIFCNKCFCDGFSTQINPKNAETQRMLNQRTLRQKFKGNSQGNQSNCQMSRQALGSNWLERRWWRRSVSLHKRIGNDLQVCQHASQSCTPFTTALQGAIAWGRGGEETERKKQKKDKRQPAPKHKTHQLFSSLNCFVGRESGWRRWLLSGGTNEAVGKSWWSSWG